MRWRFVIMRRDAKEVIGIDHLFCVFIVGSRKNRPKLAEKLSNSHGFQTCLNLR